MNNKEKSKCAVCKKREATTEVIRPFEVLPISVCEKCFHDIIEEDND